MSPIAKIPFLFVSKFSVFTGIVFYRYLNPNLKLGQAA